MNRSDTKQYSQFDCSQWQLFEFCQLSTAIADLDLHLQLHLASLPLFCCGKARSLADWRRSAGCLSWFSRLVHASKIHLNHLNLICELSSLNFGSLEPNFELHAPCCWGYLAKSLGTRLQSWLPCPSTTAFEPRSILCRMLMNFRTVTDSDCWLYYWLHRLHLTQLYFKIWELWINKSI